MKNSFIIEYKNDDVLLKEIQKHFIDKNDIGKIQIENKYNFNMKDLVGWTVRIYNHLINNYLETFISKIDETNNIFEVTFKEINVYLDNETNKYNFF